LIIRDSIGKLHSRIIGGTFEGGSHEIGIVKGPKLHRYPLHWGMVGDRIVIIEDDVPKTVVEFERRWETPIRCWEEIMIASIDVSTPDGIISTTGHVKGLDSVRARGDGNEISTEVEAILGRNFRVRGVVVKERVKAIGRIKWCSSSVEVAIDIVCADQVCPGSEARHADRSKEECEEEPFHF